MPASAQFLEQGDSSPKSKPLGLMYGHGTTTPVEGDLDLVKRAGKDIADDEVPISGL